MCGEIVVNYDTLPNAINEKPYSIHAIRVDLSSLENPFEDNRELTERSKGTQEITVP